MTTDEYGTTDDQLRSRFHQLGEHLERSLDQNLGRPRPPGSSPSSAMWLRRPPSNSL